MIDLKSLCFTCSEIPDCQLEVLINPGGESSFLVNDGADGESGCMGEVCLNREQTIHLRDWLTRELRRTKKP